MKHWYLWVATWTQIRLWRIYDWAINVIEEEKQK